MHADGVWMPNSMQYWVTSSHSISSYAKPNISLHLGLLVKNFHNILISLVFQRYRWNCCRPRPSAWNTGRPMTSGGCRTGIGNTGQIGLPSRTLPGYGHFRLLGLSQREHTPGCNGHDIGLGLHATFVAQHLLRNKNRSTFVAVFHVTRAIFVGGRSAWNEKHRYGYRVGSFCWLTFFALIRPIVNQKTS